MLAKLEREVMLMKEEKEGREENSFVVWVAVAVLVLVLALVVVILVFTVVVMELVVRLMGYARWTEWAPRSVGR